MENSLGALQHRHHDKSVSSGYMGMEKSLEALHHLQPHNSAALGYMDQAFQLGVKSPLELDAVLRHMGLEPRLVNPFFATQITYLDSSWLYLPIQISVELGGRKSIYHLQTGEEVPTGYLIKTDANVGGSEIMVRWMGRLSGQGFAVNGDRFVERIKKVNGDLLAEWVGELEILDPTRGIGRLKALASSSDIIPLPVVWVFWSGVLIAW